MRTPVAALVLASLFTAALLPAAVLADPPEADQFTAGMLTFFVQAEIFTPVPNQGVNNPMLVQNNSENGIRYHYVKITGPASTGGINIDYTLKFKLDAGGPSEHLVGELVTENTTIGLDGTGTWKQSPLFKETLNLAAGPHTAKTESYLKFRPSGVSKSISHTHPF